VEKLMADGLKFMPLEHTREACISDYDKLENWLNEYLQGRLSNAYNHTETIVPMVISDLSQNCSDEFKTTIKNRDSAQNNGYGTKQI
jgi:hypothetical protein